MTAPSNAAATTAGAVTATGSVTDPAVRPLPEPTDVSRPHWDGCRRGELLFQRCEGCRRAIFPPALLCPYCNSGALRWEASSGLGTVYSHSVVHRPQQRVFEAPYVVAVVELEEGWHMFTNVVFRDVVNRGSTAVAPQDVVVGMPVKVRYIEVENAVLPCFEARA
jgi:uncharacterized OB-fold protein